MLCEIYDESLLLFRSQFGPNKTPMIAICFVAFLALIFILIGNLNVISPMITCNFMLVYAVVDYAHFALMMECEMDVSNKGEDSVSVLLHLQSDRLLEFHNFHIEIVLLL